MTVPYTPTPFAVPVVNPGVGGLGAPPISYLSNQQYIFAPTAIDAVNLIPGNPQNTQAQALADTIARASAWADNYCFGADAAAKGVSLAASLSVESASVKVRTGELRLVCDYKPILQVMGVDVGMDPSSVTSVGAQAAAATRVGRRTIYVPYGTGFISRPGDTSGWVPSWSAMGRLYAVWSYVNGYPHTSLVSSVTQGATTCDVEPTDGAGGVWGVFPASGAFPGTALTIYNQNFTETVYVQGITPGTPTVLTTSPFRFAHNLPAAPDFLPVTGIPADVQQAVIWMTTALIKTRGARAMVMPQMPGQAPNRQAFAQAGAWEDMTAACKILDRYTVRVKAKS